VAHVAQLTAQTLDQSAVICDMSESYRRRQEDWQLMADTATNEMLQCDAQIKNLQEQIAMAGKQIALTQMEQAHAQAVYALQSTRFSGKELYNWMVGRLSGLYYQLYDATLPLCLMSKLALEKEVGNQKTASLFALSGWSNLYQGLLAGEGLMMSLQKLDQIWLEDNQRGMEARKTVSLDALIRKGSSADSLSKHIATLLLQDGEIKPAGSGITLALENGIYSALLDLSTLDLPSSYNQSNTKKGRIKSLSVTLPALLGPYQDIEATLSLNGQTIALSHGMNDSGLFVTDYNDARYLPFEGMDPTSGQLTLALYRVNEGQAQRSLLQSLSDVILHLDYTIKDR
jgi:hypothetical protein